MTQTFGQLGSGSAGRDARDTAPPRRLSHTGSLDAWGRKMVRGCCECQPPLALQREHLVTRGFQTPDTFVSRRTGAKAQDSCAGQRIDAETSHNTPLRGHLATA